MPLGLVTWIPERGEEFSGCWGCWGCWIEGQYLVVDLDGRGPGGAQRVDELLVGDAGGVLEVTADREGGEHDGQVRFDGIALIVKDGPGAQIGCGRATTRASSGSSLIPSGW